MNPTSPSSPGLARALLAFGVVGPILAFGVTLTAIFLTPALDPARRYLSELGVGRTPVARLFDDGIFVAGLMTGVAGAGFALALTRLTGAWIAAMAMLLTFGLAAFGLACSAVYLYPDPRHLAINLALGIQLAPLLLLWGLWSRADVPRLKVFLALAFAAMAVLTLLTKHVVFPGAVNDANVGWWERAYAIVLVGWVAVAAAALDGRLSHAPGATKTSG